MKIAEVVIANDSRAVDRIFHYLMPEDMEVSIGVRVLVPFGAGNKTTSGVIVGFVDKSDFPSLKQIINKVDDRPLFNRALIDLAKWMQQKYLCTYYRALKTIMPTGAAVKTTEWITIIKDNEEVKAASQKAVLQRIREAGGTADFGYVSDMPNARAAVNALKAKGIISLTRARRKR